MAQHGSGDRTPAVGYRIMTLRVLPNGTVASYDVFAEGWLQNPGKRQFWGAPVLWARSAACMAAGLTCIAEQPCSDLTRCTLPGSLHATEKGRAPEGCMTVM